MLDMFFYTSAIASVYTNTYITIIVVLAVQVHAIVYYISKKGNRDCRKSAVTSLETCVHVPYNNIIWLPRYLYSPHTLENSFLTFFHVAFTDGIAPFRCNASASLIPRPFQLRGRSNVSPPP